jgi:hypothetical protein
MIGTARLALLLLLALAAGDAAALRCDGRLVQAGDHAVQVRARCGEPFWIDAFSELLVLGEDGPLEQRIERPVEAWYYNFGPSRLLRRLLLVDDRVVREETLGYGVARIGGDCRLDALPAGTPAGVIYARCGAPTSRRDRYAEVVRRDGSGAARRRLLRHEDWIYDVGANRDLRLVRIVDGRLQGIERLDR